MSEEAGGASPRRGFHYQDIAAAAFFITDLPEGMPLDAEKLYIERFDSDFAFQIESSDKEIHHYFEVKNVENGELKWGSKFKGSVFPEFYRISEKHATQDEGNPAYFHLVTNGAAASRVSEFEEESQRLEGPTKWEIFKRRYGRDELRKLLRGIESEETVNNDDEVTLPENVDDLFHPVWGLKVHTPTEEELKLKLKDHLRSCAPANFRDPMNRILNEIHSMGSGVITKQDLREVADIPLEPRDEGISSVKSKGSSELRSDVEVIFESRSDTQANVPEIRQEKENIREYGERVKQNPETNSTSVESATEISDELYEKIEDLARQKSRTEAELSNQINRLINEDDRTSSNPEDHD